MGQSPYWHDIMKGFGWQDVCARHSITDPRKQHYVRELVLGKTDKPKNFSIVEWRSVSGTDAQISSIGKRADRPNKSGSVCESCGAAILDGNKRVSHR